MFKQVLAATALAALAACGGGGGGAMPIAAAPQEPVKVAEPAKAPEPVKPDCSVALWGDSIMAGVVPSGYLAETPAMGIKRLRPAYRVVDKSEPGTGAVGRLQMFESEPVTTRVVVIEWGINDAVTTTAEYYEGALREMVAYVKRAGSLPVITGLSYPTGNFRPERDEFNAVALKVAADTGVDFGLWDHVAYADGDNADVIHPGQAYSTRLVEAITRALDRVSPECAA